MALVTATEGYGTARAVKDAEAFPGNPFLVISKRQTLRQWVLVGSTEARE
jgi:hypothetical protein